MGNTIEAENHGQISKRLSIAGVIIGVILLAIFIACYVVAIQRVNKMMAGQTNDPMINQGNHYGGSYKPY